MENLSRAITIAAGILIAMLIVSLIVFGFSRLTKYQNKEAAEKNAEQIIEFNNQFYAYDQKVVTGYKLVSLAHLTIDVNKRKNRNEEGYKDIEVYLRLKNTDERLPQSYDKKIQGSNYFDLLDYVPQVFDNMLEESEREKFKQLYFECEKVELDKDTSRVWKMYFKQIKQK